MSGYLTIYVQLFDLAEYLGRDQALPRETLMSNTTQLSEFVAAALLSL